jgi:hypothetical protein
LTRRAVALSSMNDIAMVLLALAFFGVAWLYVRGLERL